MTARERCEGANATAAVTTSTGTSGQKCVCVCVCIRCTAGGVKTMDRRRRRRLTKKKTLPPHTRSLWKGQNKGGKEVAQEGGENQTLKIT